MCETKIQSLKKYVSEKISSFLDTLNMAIRGTIFLFLILLMGLFLAIIIASSIEVTDTVELLSVSYSVILVAITVIYVSLTWQIVKQTDKNSEIAFIEKRFEKLYYPLKDVLEHPIILTLSGEKHEYIDMNKINNIVPFQYLASKNIEASLDIFINDAHDERIHGDLIVEESYDKYTQYKIVTKEIKTIVDKDIETYRNELKKLI